MVLTFQQIHQFYHQGFFVLDNLFQEDEIEQIRCAFTRLQGVGQKLENTQVIQNTQFVVEEGAIKRIVWVSGYEPMLGIFGRDQRITKPASQLLGTPVLDQLICQAHYKLPNDGVEFPWHQDSEHRGYGTDLWKDVNEKGSYVQTLTAIDEITLENSPLKVIPGSCRQGHLGLTLPQNLERYVDDKKSIPVLMKPGSTLFFNPYLIHGSSPNLSTKPRRVFINGFAYPGSNKKVYPGAGLGVSLEV